MTTLLRLSGEGPLHGQVYEAVRQGVLSGRLAPGTRLPPSRTLARDLGVSRTVVVAAFERLSAEGVLQGRVGAGTFVHSDLADLLPFGAPDTAASRATIGQGPLQGGSPLEPPALSAWGSRVLATGRSTWRPFEGDGGGPPIDFRYGRPDSDAFPTQVWRRIVTRTARNTVPGYGPTAGAPRLRGALVDYLARARGVRCDIEQVLIASGSQQILDLSARVLLDPGDRVVIEDPHYQGARQAFAAAGAEILPVPVDEDGLIPEALPMGRPFPRLAYVTPSHQFPTGGVLPLGRRLALLEWARTRGVILLEDDYDSEYRYDAPPVEAIQALAGGQGVLYAGTFSKVLDPALRVGYLVMPPQWVEPFLAAKWMADRHTPSFQQEALATFIEEGHFERHLRRTRTTNARRREVLLEALHEHLGGRARVTGVSAGVHATVWLPTVDPARMDELVERVRERGVGVYSMAPYTLGPPTRAGLLLGYSALREGRIRRGVRVLAEVLSEMGG